LALRVADIIKAACSPLTGDAAEATKEKSIAEIVDYVERVAVPALARWVCYRFWDKMRGDQHTHEGWSQVSRDIAIEREDAEDFAGEERPITPADVLAALAEDLASEDGLFLGFAGYRRVANSSIQAFLDTLAQRVGEALRNLDGKVAVDLCAFLRVAHRAAAVGDIPDYEENFEAGDYDENEGFPHEVFCRNPPAAFSSQLIVDIHQFQCNGYYPGRYHVIAFVPSPAGKMVPIDTGTRVYQEMYGASGDEVFETAKVCHMEPVRFDTRGYTGNVL